MKKSGILIILLTVLAGFVSCRKVSDPLLSYGQIDAQAFDDAKTSYEKQFTALWTALNCNYGIWDFEAEHGLDWDAVLQEYTPRFQALDKQETVTDEEFKALYEEILNPLHDGHLAIQVQNRKTQSFLMISPSNNRILSSRKAEMDRDSQFKLVMSTYKEMSEGPMRITQSLVPDHPVITTAQAMAAIYSQVLELVQKGAPAEDAPEQEKLIYQFCQEFSTDFISFAQMLFLKKMDTAAIIANMMANKYAMLGSFMGFSIPLTDTATADMDPGIEYHLFGGNIPYLRISGFYLTPWLNDASFQEIVKNPQPTTLAYREQTIAAWRGWMNAIASLKAAGQLKGVIIDLRSNGGGAMSDFQYVAGALVPPGGYSFHKIRTKQGVGRYDYSPLIDCVFNTLEEEHTVVDQEPVVVLCNTLSVSMAEMNSAAVKSLPNGFLIGSRTWGGLSALNTDPSEYSRLYAGIVGEMDKTPFFAYIPRLVSIFPEEGILEGYGITPNVEIDLDTDLLKNESRDNQLERAVAFILNGN